MNNAKHGTRKHGTRKHDARNVSVYVIVVVLVGVIFIAGCSTSDNSGNNPPASASNNNSARGQFNGNRSGARNGFGANLTDEQRNQMMQQRTQMETDACSGMSEGDACSITFSSQYGGAGGARNGTCTVQNSTLLCMVSFNGGRGNFTRG